MKLRQNTPWGTSNAEYGRHLAAQAVLKRNSLVPSEVNMTTHSVSQLGTTPLPVPGPPSQHHGPHHLPPLDQNNYMLARDKPGKGLLHNEKTQDRNKNINK